MPQINPYRIFNGEEVARIIEITKRANTEEIMQLLEPINRDIRLDSLFDNGKDVGVCLERISKALSKRIIMEDVLATREGWQLSLQHKTFGEIPTFSSILFTIEKMYEPIPKELVGRYFSLSDTGLTPPDGEILKKVYRGEKVESIPSHMFEKQYLREKGSGRGKTLELTDEGIQSLWLYEKLTALTIEP